MKTLQRSIDSGIYQIILKEDGRSYVGSALSIKERWYNHRKASVSSGPRQVIARALAKYGPDNFNWIILEQCDPDPELLLEKEQSWLDKIRPFADEDRGFNVRKIANSNVGIKRTIESRQKQSKTMTGVSKTLEHRANLSKDWTKKRDPEYFQCASERMKGDKNPAKRPEVAAKISAKMTGKTWKDDKARVEKHIAQRKGKKQTEKARTNMKLAQQKNKTRSAEAKEKFYLAQRVLYNIIDPIGNQTEIYSRELKIFCRENNLQYANLITTAKNNKTYKGWKAIVLPSSNDK
jgi:group I intron endonuclease